jgi:outer membrane receptor protein involved in Fe transport
MRIQRWISVLAGLAMLPAGALSRAHAQGITTGAIGGLVTDTTGAPLADVQVQVRNNATGYVLGSITRENGRYLVPSLEAGGPYTVTARRIGFAVQTKENVFVSLTQTTRVDLKMTAQVTQLTGVAIVATTSDFSSTRTGVSTTVNDSTISRIPTLNRDFTDLVKLSPHVNSPVSGQGPSAAGTYNRFNNYTIDGANQNDRFNLASSTGTPGGAVGGRLISIDAVKEFQVLLSPADVRYGNFAGMLVNAVTKSGTNQLTGGATYAFRNPSFAANEDFIRNSDFKVQQYGFYLGGPIIKDKLHFFIAPEWQSRSQPAIGPYEGGPNDPGNISPDTLRRIAAAMQPFFNVGSTGLVNVENPLTNLSGRLDWQLNDRNRVTFRQLYNKANQDNFSRNSRTFSTAVGTQNSGFRLGSNSYSAEDDNISSVLQVFSQVGKASSNEFLVGYNKLKDERIVPINTPEISVSVTNLQGGVGSSVTFGTEEFSPGNLLKQDIIEVSNNFNTPIGSHNLTFGGRYEHTKIYDNFAQRANGVYAFASISALEARTPLNYSLGYSNGGPIPADFNIGQISVYGQDRWNVNDRFTLTYGVRADVPQYLDKPVQNDKIAAAFVAAGLPAVNTSATPKTHIYWSPRVGFNWDPNGDNKNQVRGTVGVFTSPTPGILIGNAYQNTGLGLVTLNCSGAATPDFTTDVKNLPRACKGQANPAPGQAGTAGVNVNDPDFKNPQNFTTSIGFDRQLPKGFIFTFEGLYRKAINGILVRDLNLKGPRLVGGQPYQDRNGRILYADTISATGGVTNTNQRVIGSIGTPAVTFSEGVIQVTNESKDYSYSLSGQIRRRFGESLSFTAGYTFMHSYDIQSLTSDRAISNWRNGGQFSGLETDQPLTYSVFDRPNRVTASGTYTAPWKKAPTEVSFYYSGFTGIRYMYTANGDLNGDGFNGNDPIYVPKNATDLNEIRFVDQGSGSSLITAAAQAQAFENFIKNTPCLNDQRGKIMDRNSCTAPWSNRIDFSLRQSLPEIGGQRLTAQLDIFNFGNLVGRIVGKDDWGQQQQPVLSPTFPQQQALTVRGRTAGPLNTSYPTYNFNANLITSGEFVRSQTLASNFYQMQVTLKYSF